MIRVIGLGSPFGDDQAGWQVVERLRGYLPTDVDLVKLDRPGSALIRWMQGVEHLILVDAVVSGAVPGSLIRLTPETVATAQAHFSTHDLDLAQTLRLAAALGSLPAEVELFGIEIGDCRGESIDQRVDTAAADLARQLSGRLGARL